MYAQRTADGRIALGGRGVPYRFGSRTDNDGTTQAATGRGAARDPRPLLPVPRRAAYRARLGRASWAYPVTGARPSPWTVPRASAGRAATSAPASPPPTSPPAPWRPGPARLGPGRPNRPHRTALGELLGTPLGTGAPCAGSACRACTPSTARPTGANARATARGRPGWHGSRTAWRAEAETAPARTHAGRRPDTCRGPADDRLRGPFPRPPVPAPAGRPGCRVSGPWRSPSRPATRPASSMMPAASQMATV